MEKPEFDQLIAQMKSVNILLAGVLRLLDEGLSRQYPDRESVARQVLAEAHRATLASPKPER